MPQFDVYEVSGRLVVDLQTDLLGLNNTRLVAPLRDGGQYASFVRLTPKVEVNGRVWIVRVQEMAAVPGLQLKTRIASLAAYRDDLKRAIDLLVDGV